MVDDAPWLDRASAQALAFAARRLLAESVLILFATREADADFSGLPELALGGLRDTDAGGCRRRWCGGRWTSGYGYPAGAPALPRLLGAFCRGDVAPEDEIRWSFVACHSAHDLWDDEGWHELSARYLQLARDLGALAVLPIALAQRVGLHRHTAIRGGRFAARRLWPSPTTGSDARLQAASGQAGRPPRRPK